MFTGIVEEQGEVLALNPLTIRGPLATSDAAPGSSIAVNGCCLTVTTMDSETFTADVMAETRARTDLGRLQVGDRVNLERPVALGSRLDGHLLQGHVDGVGLIAARDGERLTIGLPSELARYVVVKGSIAVDGVSLTVVSADDREFTVALIPETESRTTLGHKPVGATVNLEVDVLAKYVERMLAGRPA